MIAAGFFFFWNHDWVVEKDIIYLKNGTIIDADDSWTSGQFTYYRKDWHVERLSGSDVEYIGKGDARQRKKGSRIVKSILSAVKSEISSVTAPEISEKAAPANSFSSNLFKICFSISFC